METRWRFLYYSNKRSSWSPWMKTKLKAVASLASAFDDHADLYSDVKRIEFEDREDQPERKEHFRLLYEDHLGNHVFMTHKDAVEFDEHRTAIGCLKMSYIGGQIVDTHFYRSSIG